MARNRKKMPMYSSDKGQGVMTKLDEQKRRINTELAKLSKFERIELEIKADMARLTSATRYDKGE